MAKIVPSLLIIFLIPLVLSQDYEDGSEIGPDAMNDLMSDIDAMGSDYGEGESEDDENGDQYGSESIENEEIETQQSSPEHQLAKRVSIYIYIYIYLSIHLYTYLYISV